MRSLSTVTVESTVPFVAEDAGVDGRVALLLPKDVVLFLLLSKEGGGGLVGQLLQSQAVVVVVEAVTTGVLRSDDVGNDMDIPFSSAGDIMDMDMDSKLRLPLLLMLLFRPRYGSLYSVSSASDR